MNQIVLQVIFVLVSAMVFIGIERVIDRLAEIAKTLEAIRNLLAAKR